MKKLKLTVLVILFATAVALGQEFSTRAALKASTPLDTAKTFWLAGQIIFPDLSLSQQTINYIGARIIVDSLTVEIFIGSTGRKIGNSFQSVQTAAVKHRRWQLAALAETAWRYQTLHSMAQVFWKWRVFQFGPEYEGYWRWGAGATDTWTVGPRVNFNFKTATLGASWLMGNRNPVFRAYVVVNI